MRASRLCLTAACTALVPWLLVLPVAPAAAFEDLPDGITVTPGANAHAQMPVRVDVPVPATDRAVTSVEIAWQEQPATGGTRFYQRRSVATPDCVAHQPCTAETVLPTAGMIGTTPLLTVSVHSGAHLMGMFFQQASVDNPKPTARLTAPADGTHVWGTVRLAAEAAPSARTDGAPLEGVRFYVNPLGLRDDPYVFDETAPYEVDVDVERPPLGRQEVYAVAEDTEGNLTPISQPDPDPATMRVIRVGPPPLVDWETPLPGRAAGSMVSGIGLGWHAALPDPFNNGGVPGPFLTQIDVLIDGQPWESMPYQDVFTPWTEFGEQVSEARYTHAFMPAPHFAAGAHTATVRARTSYGTTAESTVDFLIADDLTLSRPVVNGQRLTDWHVVTAGQRLRFSVQAASRAGTALLESSVRMDGRDIATGDPICPGDPVGCPTSAALRGVWTAPLRPGEHRVIFRARTDGEDDGIELFRTIVVQPAARLTARASDDLVVARTPVRVTGRLTRTDTGAGVEGVPVGLQARVSRDEPWRRVAALTTGARGRLVTQIRPTTGRWYRFTYAGEPGTLGTATSAPVQVRVRP